jgi:hypothetical protein
MGRRVSGDPVFDVEVHVVVEDIFSWVIDSCWSHADVANLCCFCAKLRKIGSGRFA